MILSVLVSVCDVIYVKGIVRQFVFCNRHYIFKFRDGAVLIRENIIVIAKRRAIMPSFLNFYPQAAQTYSAPLIQSVKYYRSVLHNGFAHRKPAESRKYSENQKTGHHSKIGVRAVFEAERKG